MYCIEYRKLRKPYIKDGYYPHGPWKSQSLYNDKNKAFYYKGRLKDIWRSYCREHGIIKIND